MMIQELDSPWSEMVSQLGEFYQALSDLYQKHGLLRLSPCITQFRETTASYLAHKVGNDTVEGGTFVAEARLPCAQLPEVLCKTQTLTVFRFLLRV